MKFQDFDFEKQTVRISRQLVGNLKLKEKGVLVRHFDAPRISNWLRITIGTPEQMQTFMETLDKIMEE